MTTINCDRILPNILKTLKDCCEKKGMFISFWGSPKISCCNTFLRFFPFHSNLFVIVYDA